MGLAYKWCKEISRMTTDELWGLIEFAQNEIKSRPREEKISYKGIKNSNYSSFEPESGDKYKFLQKNLDALNKPVPDSDVKDLDGFEGNLIRLKSNSVQLATNLNKFEQNSIGLKRNSAGANNQCFGSQRNLVRMERQSIGSKRRLSDNEFSNNDSDEIQIISQNEVSFSETIPFDNELGKSNDESELLIDESFYDRNEISSCKLTESLEIDYNKIPAFIPPYKGDLANKLSDSLIFNTYTLDNVCDELLPASFKSDMTKTLVIEKERENNLIIFLNYYEKHYLNKLISLKKLNSSCKINLTYNPIRFNFWRIQDFKLNKKSEYNINEELKKTKRYWENKKIPDDNLTDNYLKNYYRFFENIKDIENPLHLNDRISYPDTQEREKERNFLNDYRHQTIKKMLYLALNHTISQEKRGYIFHNKSLNKLVNNGLFQVNFDDLKVTTST
ncbi:hypothetical protein QEN19_003115 [Hanseniaspora menglaensis]